MNKYSIFAALSLSVAGCARASLAPTAAAVTHDACAGGEVGSDAELSRYAGCSTISGDMAVSGASTLSPLASVRSVGGTLWIRDTSSLETLAGLDRLESASTLMLTRNENLRDVSALSRLHALGSLLVMRNPALSSFEGLQNVRRLEHLTAVGNGLVSLAGLENLREVDHITISRNAKLRDIGALDQVNDAESVKVDHNGLLSAQAGMFHSLPTTPVAFIIEANWKRTAISR